MKKYSLHSVRKSLIAIFAGLLISTSTFAAGEDMTDLIDYLQKVVNRTATSVADYIYEFNALLPKTVATNLNASTAEKSTQDYTKILSLCQVYNSLPRHNEAPEPTFPDELKKMFGNKYSSFSALCSAEASSEGVTIDKKKESDAFKKELASIFATDSEGPKTVGAYTMQKKSSTSLENDNSFSFENLILPSLYTDKEKDHALNLVAFSAKTYEPFPLTQEGLKKALGNPTFANSREFINYKMAVRSYIAAQSFAVSNLYRMIAERTKQKEIADLDLKDDKGNSIESPLQYQEYLATQRVNNPDWYNTMNSASANTLSREMVFILAEIQRSLYRMEKTNERVLATLSILELITLNANVRPELKVFAPGVEALGTGSQEGVPTTTP